MTKIPDSSAQIYARLVSYVLPYWPAFIFSMFGFALYAISNVGFVQLLNYIVGSLGGDEPFKGTLVAEYIRQFFGESAALHRTIIPMGMIAIMIVRGLGTFIGNYFISYVGTNLVHNLRVELFDRLLILPSSYYDRNAMGHLVAKLTYHVAQVTGAATNGVRVIIREGLTVTCFLAYLLFLNWKLTLIFLAVAPFIALLVNFAGKRFRRISERIQDSMGEITHVASETMQGYKEIRTFGASQHERERFRAVSSTNRRQSMKMVVTSSIATPAVQLMVGIALAGLVWFALDPVLSSNMGAGDVVSFLVAGGLLAKPIRQLSEVVAIVQKGLAAAEDIFDLFDEEIEPDDGRKELDQVKGKIEFRDVSFSYEQSESPVLQNISFVAEPGKTIALVGRSGSGKSTLASLIPRFYAPKSGTILLDDEPIAGLTLANLRRHLAVVTQDVTLFNNTVAKNIAFGASKDSSRVEIRSAAEKAYALPFIEEFEEGLDTVVGDDGVLLSGGQRQRLAIARAFLKDAPVLILDEATSALDSESERYIQSALEAVARGRTTIIIAHRLSTIENADQILVLDQGRIVEQGTHLELIAKGAHYASLHNHLQDSDTPELPVVAKSDFRFLPVSRESGFRWLSADFNPLLRAWYADSGWVKLLTPVAYIFSRIAAIRRKRIKSWQAPVPVIVIGNINVGGTGKSPLVAWLAIELRALGHNPGIVSRGYRGKAPQYPLQVTAMTDLGFAGDEAVMLARKTDCPIVVDPDRTRAVQKLLQAYDCDVVISDDGLQHYSLGRDVEVAVVDSSKGLGNGLCLPAGPLREPPERLKEVDVVVVNGGENLNLPCKYVRMTLEPKQLVNLTSDKAREEGLSSNTIHAIAGIENPDRFFRTLISMGYEIIEHRYEDHHHFLLTDLSFGDSLPVVMTEKDAIKCRLLNSGLIHDNFWYLEVEVEISPNFLPTVLRKIGLNIAELKLVFN